MKQTIALAAVALSLVASACSSGTAPSTSDASPATTVASTGSTSDPLPATTVTPSAPPTPTTTSVSAIVEDFPVQIRHDEGVATIPSRPERVAALSGSHVEMLFAIGAGRQLIAGDLFSDYPPGEVDGLELIDSFNLNVEAVIALDPDLVVLTFDPGDAVAALEVVGIPTLMFATASDLDDVYNQIVALGRATGHESAARQLAATMREEVDAIVAGSGSSTAGLSFYHESDPFSYYTPNSSSFIGGLYELLGMVNIADAAPDEFNSGFPQLSAEFIVTANPDVILLAGFGETIETLAAREGWGSMSAVAGEKVVVLDYDTASRWGPRVVDLLRAMAEGAAAVGGG